MVFVDGIRTQDDIQTYSRRLAQQGIPCLYNGALVSAYEAAQMGFRMQILAGLALGAVYTSANEAMLALKETGTTEAVRRQYQLPDDEGLNEMLGLSQAYEVERRYAAVAVS